MKHLFLALFLLPLSLQAYANASDDEGFHDCRLAAGELAQVFIDKAAAIDNLKATKLYFSNIDDRGYLFYGSISHQRYEVVIEIADEESCIPKSATLNPQ